MASDRKTTSNTAYRVCGEPDGVPVSTVIGPGRHVAGASPECDIVIPVRGVSRRHAVFTVGGNRLVLEDLDAKNGTFLNGRPVLRGEVRLQDRIHLGPAELRIEPADYDDGALAVVLSSTTDPAADDDTTHTVRSLDASVNIRWLELIELCARAAASDPPQLDEAAQSIRQETLASAVTLVEWTGRLEPVAIATAGAIPDLGASETLRRAVIKTMRSARREPVTGSLATGEPPHLAAAVHAVPHHQPWILAVSGAPATADLTPVLEVLVRVLGLGREHPEVREQLDSRARQLRIPEGHLRACSAAMQELYRQICLLASTATPVLITGETGVGKEHVAWALHLTSSRHQNPFIAVNCAAIPNDLLEAELFGIERAVATGVDARPGQLELADGGTLLLDEIGELPLALQAKLLRVVDTLEIQPVGAPRTRRVDVRLLAATNSDLSRRLADGSFRPDLYYRLAGTALEVPPLRHRRDDIGPLIQLILTQTCSELGRPVRGITLKALRILEQSPWPGNVRQLQHEIRRLVTLCPPDHAIDSEMLPDDVLAASPPDEPLTTLNLDDHLAATERRLLTLALQRTSGNQSKAAKLLGISRNGLAKKLRRHGVTES